MSRQAQVTLTEGSIAKGIVSFAIPMFLGNLFQQLYNVCTGILQAVCWGR